MPNVLIRNLPVETHAVLTRRAAAQRKSLQSYLTTELERMATQRTVDEIFAELEAVGGGWLGGPTAVEALDEARAEHDARF